MPREKKKWGGGGGGGGGGEDDCKLVIDCSIGSILNFYSPTFNHDLINGSGTAWWWWDAIAAFNHIQNLFF